MAFSTSFMTPNNWKLTVYNIDWSVGQIGSNTREDVMLVQALLRMYYYELAGHNQDFEPPAGQTGIAVDGLKGPVTQKHITRFQEQSKAVGYKVMVDGIFDPFRGPEVSSTLSKSRYALELLNFGCYNNCHKQGMDNYVNLPNREDIPPALRSALKRNKKTASKYTYVAPVTVPTTGGA